MSVKTSQYIPNEVSPWSYSPGFVLAVSVKAIFSWCEFVCVPQWLTFAQDWFLITQYLSCYFILHLSCKIKNTGTSLAVQWLKLWASTSGNWCILPAMQYATPPPTAPRQSTLVAYICFRFSVLEYGLSATLQRNSFWGNPHQVNVMIISCMQRMSLSFWAKQHPL